jgi:hypothetical protein
MLSHRIRPVSEILAPHVEHLWVVRGYSAARWRNMILPDGAIELIVDRPWLRGFHVNFFVSAVRILRCGFGS